MRHLFRWMAWSVVCGCVGGDVKPDPSSTEPPSESDPTDSGTDTGTDADPESVTSLQFGDWVSILSLDSHQTVAHGDVDGDGHLDFVVSSSDGPWTWLQGDGAAGFSDTDAWWTETVLDGLLEALGSAICVGADCTLEMVFVARVDLADLDGDGRDELLCTFTASDTSGEYWKAAATLDLSVEGVPTLLAADGTQVVAEPIADVDNDGGAEVLLYTWDDSYLLRNGELDAIEPFSVVLAGNFYPQSWTSDLDDDGDLDIISFLNWGFGISGAVAMMRQEDGQFEMTLVDDQVFGNRAVGNGEGRTPATEILLTTSEEIFWVAGGKEIELLSTFEWGELTVFGSVFGDFNGSGLLDILSPTIDQTTALAGDGQGGFEEFDTISMGLDYAEMAADIDDDGLDDLYRLVWNKDASGYELQVMRNESG